MERKIIAVINDQTGTVHAALEGYQSSSKMSFPESKLNLSLKKNLACLE